METKRSQVISHYLKGELKDALRIAKNFYREFSSEERRILSIAYECLSGKERFYTQLGENPESVKKSASEILAKYAK